MNMANKKIILAGGDNMISLVGSLVSKGYTVVAINPDRGSCARIAECSDVLVINGDPAVPQILKEADAEGADMVIAAMPRDEVNLVVCELCKKQFHVKRTAAQLTDREKVPFFKKMGVDFTISLSAAAESLIDECAAADQVISHLPFTECAPKVFEAQIPNSSPAAGMCLWELDLPKQALVCCIMRGSQSIVPKGDTRLLAGDTLVLIAAPEQKEETLKKLLG